MFGMGKSILFLIKALLFGVASVIAVPKHQYKKYLIYGIFFGGFIDIVIITVFNRIRLLQYLNLGPFSILGIFSFWTPIAWMFAVMIFLYYLPIRKIFFYPYIIFWAVYGIFVGLVLEGFGLFSFNKPILFLIFLVWFFFAALAFTYLERIRLKSNIKRS